MLIFYSIPPLKEIGITLLASAGIFAAILGLASQQAFSNIISGIFIVVFKPFRVGDNIEINNNRGIVEDVTLRHTIDEQKDKSDPKVIIRVLGYGELSVNLRGYVWSVDSHSGFVMKCDLYKSIKERFDKEGIEIPYPHRTIIQKKNESN